MYTQACIFLIDGVNGTFYTLGLGSRSLSSQGLGKNQGKQQKKTLQRVPSSIQLYSVTKKWYKTKVGIRIK